MRHPYRSDRCKLPHHGFTLIELMAALILLGLLLTAITGLIPRFIGTAREDESGIDLMDRQWSRVAMERLATDLENCTTIAFTGTSMLLRGRLGRDPITRQMNDTNATCEYRIEAIGNRVALIRAQEGESTLLGLGDFVIRIESSGLRTESQILFQLPADDSRPQERFDLPGRFRLTIQSPKGALATRTVERSFRLSSNLASGEVRQ